MNKITKKSILRFLSLSLLTLMLFSCRGLFDSPKIESMQDGPFVVTGRISNSMDSSASGARSASSSNTESEKFWYKVIATPSDAGLEVKETIVSSKEYSFVLDKGTWTFNVEAYLVEASDEITDSTIPILVSDNNPECDISSSSVTLTLIVLKLNTAAGATGTFSLPVDVTGTEITSCKVEFINMLGGTNPAGFTANALTVSETGHKIITLQSISNIPAGYYLMRMEFYSGTNGAGIRLYSRTEMITIYPGASNTLYVVKWNNANNILEITTSLIEGNRNHEVYVDTSVSVSGSGSYFDPFKTLTEAMDYINTVNDGNDTNIEYSITLCSDITGAPATGSDAFVEIEPSHPIELTIKSKGDSEIYKIQPTARGRGISFKGITGKNCLFTLQNVAITGYGFSTGTTPHLGAYVYENATVQLTGATYINYIAVENDVLRINIPSELIKIYKTATDKYSTEETGNTLLKNFIYVPQSSYAEDKQYLTGNGLAASYMNIGIEDELLADSKKQKWEFLSTGYIQKFFLYVKKLTSIPAAGETVYVKDAADLYALQTLVNSGYLTNAEGNQVILATIGIPFEGVIFEQLEDIDLSTNDDTELWTPIGKYNSDVGATLFPFSGNYDGGGNTISKLLMKPSSGNDLTLGLFGYVKKGSVKDLTVSGVITTTGDSTVEFVAGVVAYLDESSVDNCVNDVGISINKTIVGAKIGGIVANAMNDSTITNCIAKAAVSVTTADTILYMGGITGMAYGTVIDNVENEGIVICSNLSGVVAEAGGIVGYLYESQIYNSINRGTVTILSESHVGGIAGSLFGTANEIYNCYNKAYVSAGTGGYSAGIVGYAEIYASYTLVDIRNCVSYESFATNIPGKSGIINVVKSTASDPDTIGTISNCYWYIPSGITFNMKGNADPDTVVENCSSFTLNDPMDDWYGTLETPVNAGEATNVIALVYALNQWVEKNTGTQTYSQWCVTDGKLAFGTAPTGTPPAASTSSLSDAFKESIQQMKNGDTTVYVETPEDLKALACLVNSGAYVEGSDDIEITSNQQKFTGITVVQTAYIDLSDLYDAESFPSWVPIGSSSTELFQGTYNGNNFKIDGLKIEITDSSLDFGLFGYVKNGEVLNCYVSGRINISGYCSADNGGIVAILQNSRVTNCTANVNVTYSSTVSYASAAGGVVGKVSSTSSGKSYINNCVNIGIISVSGTTCYAGGIAGNVSSECEIINCINKGTVSNNSSSDSLASGGIAGNASAKVTIQNCYSNGDITSLNSTGNAGGIIGNLSGAYTSTINNCVNNSNIANYGNKYGIAGNSYFAYGVGTVSNCYFTTSNGISAAIMDSSNITATNNTSFTSTQLFTLPTALNNWVDNANDSDPDKYLSWAYESSKGLYLLPPPEVANPPIAGHTYASTMSSVPSSGTVYIREAADLQQISTWSKTSKLENVTFIMDYDVSLEGVDWNQIGYSSSYRFAGIFDGNGKEILNLSKTIDDDFGFFKRTDGATIKNLKISGDITITGTGSAYGAGFIAYAENTTVRNCINNVNITNESNTNSYSINPLTGGIIAICHTTNTIIDGCMNTGTISAKYKGSQIGGIVGSVTTSVTIRNSINKGEIKYEGTSTSNINLGGIIANFNTSNTGYFTIENCANKANFVVTSADSATVSAGGIIGLESTKKAESVIKNCFSIGQIEFPGKNPTDLSISQAGINATSGSLATMTNCYWDNTKMPNWKNGDNTEDPDNFIKSVNSNSDYYMGPIGSYTYGYLKSYLQLWVDENNTDSLYQNWALAPGGQEERGQGEPVLPIEQTP